MVYIKLNANEMKNVTRHNANRKLYNVGLFFEFDSSTVKYDMPNVYGKLNSKKTTDAGYCFKLKTENLFCISGLLNFKSKGWNFKFIIVCKYTFSSIDGDIFWLKI